MYKPYSKRKLDRGRVMLYRSAEPTIYHAATTNRETSSSRNLEYKAGSRPQKLKVSGMTNRQNHMKMETDLAVIDRWRFTGYDR
jgi:hypothetical protein